MKAFVSEPISYVVVWYKTWDCVIEWYFETDYTIIPNKLGVVEQRNGQIQQ